MDNPIEKELKALLYNFWIIKDQDKEMYYQIKHKQNQIKDFVSKNLGSKLIIHDRFIKLEKFPTIIKTNAKLSNFETVTEYVMLSIMLLFLEDKARGDYFVLSDLIEYVKNTSITLELNHIPDWNKVQDRKSLSKVIKLLEELQVIRQKDASRQSFVESIEAEALYESLATSNYLMRIFDEDISNLSTPEDFIKSEFTTQDEEKGDIRRYKVFRNILYTPAISAKDSTISELDYIKKNRNYIKAEIAKNLNMEVEITHDLAILYDEESNLEKDNFPNNKKITEIVLMVNEKLLKEIKEEKILLDNFETATITKDYFESIIKEIKTTKSSYIGKTLSKESDSKFYEMVTEYMEKYNIIERSNNEIIIFPTVSRIVGKTKEVENKNIEQIGLFGGNNEL